MFVHRCPGGDLLAGLAGEGACQLMGAGAGILSFARGRVVHRMGRSMVWGRVRILLFIWWP